VAPLVSRHATRQGFPPHRLAKADRHVPYLILGLHTSDGPLALRSNTPFNPRPVRAKAISTVLCPQAIRVGTLSHDVRISFCFFTVFPTVPSAFQLSYNVGTNLRRRSDAVLDQPLVDKIHTPPVSIFKAHGRMGYRHFTFPKHPLFADVFVPNGNAEPIDCWLLSAC
jgi:hypothetical protein